MRPIRLEYLIVALTGGVTLLVRGPAAPLEALHRRIVRLLGERGVPFTDRPDRVQVLDGHIRFEAADTPGLTLLMDTEERMTERSG